MPIGGNIEQLATLEAAFARESQTVEQLSSSIRGQLADTMWEGPAAERFRSQWNSEYEPALRRLQAALQEAGGEVARRREALLQAGG